ncbi:hypothetical protein SAY87_017491 [Trapa incisa]|uniref:Uncharacterized protein n=1 Tax=Trapa incisa TaxID=236973 RepID=A0AAN7QRX9_9MYRT|nr:hypothetical protein SAY87_017491 [Trapa incisa]
MENKALECEKQKGETDAELWKEKLKGMVSWVSQRDEKVPGATSDPHTPKPSLRLGIMDRWYHEKNGSKHMGAKPIVGGNIDIDDSDDDKAHLPSYTQIQNQPRMFPLDSDDDDAPICILKKIRVGEVSGNGVVSGGTKIKD